MTERDLFVGLDVGTTAIKAALFDAQGRVVAEASRPCQTSRPAPGIVEQDPREWTAGLVAGMDAVLTGDRAERVGAVGLCSQVNTDVFVDADGHAVAPAITWQDNRAAPQAAELDADVSAAEKTSWWGAPLPIGASHVLARMIWMAKHRPDVYAAARHVLTPKDYCLRVLAGVAIADPISNFFVVGQDLTYVEPLIARIPGARQRFPPLKFFTELVGEIRLGSSDKRAPVVAGTMDAWSGLFGAGVRKAGQGVYISGTSEILAVASAERVGAPGVVTFPNVAGLTVHAGPTQSGGDSLRWWGDAIGRDVGWRPRPCVKGQSIRPPGPVSAASRGRARASLGRSASRRLYWSRQALKRARLRARGHGGRRVVRTHAPGFARRRGRRDRPPALSRRRRRALGSLGANSGRLPWTSAR